MNNLSCILYLGAILLFASCSSSKNETINVLSEKEKEEGWELLFDGKTIDNWKTFNGGKVTGWKVIDGILHNSGVGSDHGGDIISKNQYANFELYLEWKISPQSNSGIFFHVQEGLTDAIYESGPEYQLLDDKGWPDNLESHQYSGANYGMHPPQKAEVADIQEWNSSRIVVYGANVEHWLNGVKVLSYELWSEAWHALKKDSKWAEVSQYGASQTGHIGLQDHGGLTMFRNIKIREL